MKRFIALLLIGLLLISCSGCTKSPEGGDDSDIEMAEVEDSMDIQAQADDSMKIQPENNTEKTADVPEVETVQPEPKIKSEPQPYNLNYTVKHDDSDYLSGYDGKNVSEFPTVYVIDSSQKLSQVIADMSANLKFPEKIKYREKTDATSFNYTKAKQEASIKEYYNDAFFENKILVLVISKLKDYDIVADLNSVRSDGTVQIDLLNSYSFNYRPHNYSCCEYIELNKKYANLEFKVKYNEVAITTCIDTRDLPPVYPKSVNFKATQFQLDGLTDEYISKYNGMVIFKSVEDFKNYIDTLMIIALGNVITYNITAKYDYSNKNSITARTWNKYVYSGYYNEKLFQKKFVVATPVFELSGSTKHQIRSVTDDGTIYVEEVNGVGGDGNDIKYSFELIEIDKQYKNAEFKIETILLEQDEYRWNK